MGRALPKLEFPSQHPKFVSLNPEQTTLVLEFLKYIEENWYTRNQEEKPRELARAIRNWSRFAGVTLDTHDKP